MSGVTAIQGVDDTLKKLVTGAVAGLTPLPGVTVGPLDRDDEGLRLNWFLFGIAPNTAFRNMEPPRAGWPTARGHPPLALRLRYMLTAFPASATNGGDQEQFAHAALAAAMQALHSNAVIAEGDATLSPLATPLVEPLRVTHDALDLEAVAKIWTAVSEPLRLSVGYEVSLIVLDRADAYAPGPPVRRRRIAAMPTAGPRLLATPQPRVSHGGAFEVVVAGLGGEVVFTLARAAGDPAGPAAGWPLELAPDPPPGSVLLRLSRADLAPGARALEVASATPADEALEGGEGPPGPAAGGAVAAGHDAIGITLVPRVSGPPVLPRGVPVTLECAHVGADVEVFLGAVKLDPAQVAFTTATEMTVTLPATTAPGPTELTLRSNRVAGPPAAVEVEA